MHYLERSLNWVSAVYSSPEARSLRSSLGIQSYNSAIFSMQNRCSDDRWVFRWRCNRFPIILGGKSLGPRWLIPAMYGLIIKSSSGIHAQYARFPSRHYTQGFYFQILRKTDSKSIIHFERVCVYWLYFNYVRRGYYSYVHNWWLVNEEISLRHCFVRRRFRIN